MCVHTSDNTNSTTKTHTAMTITSDITTTTLKLYFMMPLLLILLLMDIPQLLIVILLLLMLLLLLFLLLNPKPTTMPQLQTWPHALALENFHPPTPTLHLYCLLLFMILMDPLPVSNAYKALCFLKDP